MSRGLDRKGNSWDSNQQKSGMPVQQASAEPAVPQCQAPLAELPVDASTFLPERLCQGQDAFALEPWTWLAAHPGPGAGCPLPPESQAHLVPPVAALLRQEALVSSSESIPAPSGHPHVHPEV